ncbi:MAG: hypothetical protein WBI29_01040, partial [Candidatus Saccharimonadales bacterium]
MTAFFLLAIIFFITTSVVHAMSAGYFTGAGYTSDTGHKVLPAIYSDNGGKLYAIPSWVKTPADFIRFLQEYSAQPEYSITYAIQYRTGVAMIVCTMLGQDAQSCQNSGYINSSRVIQSAGWSQLSLRLGQPGITVNFDNYTKDTTLPNSLWSDKTNDVYFYNESKEHTVIQFKLNGVVKYTFYRECANPIGGLPGLPPAPQ